MIRIVKESVDVTAGLEKAKHEILAIRLQLVQDLEIPVPTLGGYVQGTSEPDFETLKLFANYFNVSADYLLNLKIGNTQSRLENEFLRIFRSLSTEQQELYLEQGKAFIRISAKDDVKSSKSTLQGKNNVG